MKGRFATILVVALSLSVVLGSGVFVYLSMGALPKYPACAVLAESESLPITQGCVAQIQHYDTVLTASASTFWTGMPRVAGLCVAVCGAIAVARSKRSFSMRKALSAIVVGTGLWFYAMFVFLDVASPGYHYQTGPFGDWAAHVVNYVIVRLGVPSFGIFGVLSLIIAMLGAVLYTFERGWLSSLSAAVLRVGAPSVLCLKIALLAVKPDQMNLHVANFLSPLEVGGVYLLNNWSALFVSASLFLAGAVRE